MVMCAPRSFVVMPQWSSVGIGMYVVPTSKLMYVKNLLISSSVRVSWNLDGLALYLVASLGSNSLGDRVKTMLDAACAGVGARSPFLS